MKTEQDLIDQGYAEGRKSFEHLWKQIEKNFQWEKVYTAMKALDWGWAMKLSDPTGALYIPNVVALKSEAYRLCKSVYDNRKGTTSTGGFQAGYIEEDNVLWLTFCLTEWSAEE